MRQWESATLVGPRDVRMTPAAAPEPGLHDLVVAPDAVGICGTDVELYEGTMAYLAGGFARYPVVPGHEWTGIVEEVGARVDGFAVGDRVVGECSIGCGRCSRCRGGGYHLCPERTETGIARRDGALRRRLVFPSRSAHRVPGHVERRDAALVEPLAVALRGVRRTGAAAGDDMGIIGAGTIGLLAAMAARALGIDPVLVDPQPSRVEFARRLGFAAEADVTAPHGHVVEASGGPGGADAAARACADGGTLVLLGLTGERVRLDLDEVVLRDLTVLGSLGSPNVWPEAIELVAERGLRPSALVSHELPLTAAPEAFALVAARFPETRKVIMDPTR